MRSYLFVIAIALSITACIDTAPLIKKTASGYPEATFYGKNLQATGEIISNACVSKGLVPENVTTNSVICVGEIESGFKQLMNAVGGTDEKNAYKFFMVSSGKNTKVIAKKTVLTSQQTVFSGSGKKAGGVFSGSGGQAADEKSERETNFFPSEVNKLQDWLYEMGAKD